MPGRSCASSSAWESTGRGAEHGDLGLEQRQLLPRDGREAQIAEGHAVGAGLDVEHERPCALEGTGAAAQPIGDAQGDEAGTGLVSCRGSFSHIESQAIPATYLRPISRRSVK